MNRPMIRLLACVLATAALGACADASEDDDASSESAAIQAVDADADAGQGGARCTTETGYTLSFSGYESPTLALSLGERTVILPGGTVAFRKRRYKNEAFHVEVYKGLGEYGATSSMPPTSR